MIRFSPRACAAFAVVAGLASFSLPASAQDDSSSGEKHPSLAGISAATPAEIASISAPNLAGLLNYCIQVEQVSHEDGDSVQTALNAKSNAVPSDQTGNMDYAIGSAGQLDIGGKRSTLTTQDAAEQGHICTAVLSRAKSLI